VRRPHPRFDETRNAWVTRAGGKLKILAKEPKNAETESQASVDSSAAAPRGGRGCQTEAPSRE
jgi:hypothetical protein